MFERFTERAIKIIMLAQDESLRTRRNIVGSEQILLGLIAEKTNIAAKLLKVMGLDLENTRITVERDFNYSSGYTTVEIPFTPCAKRILKGACQEADRRNSDEVDAEHLCLGLLLEEEGGAIAILENFGVDISELGTLVSRSLSRERKSVLEWIESRKQAKMSGLEKLLQRIWIFTN